MDTDYETRINAALGKILRNFNLLELNLGLCIRFLADPKDPKAAHDFLKQGGIPQSIKRLKKLLGECSHVSDTSWFEKWIKRAEETRVMRNYYAHATWEYLPLCVDAPLGFRIPPWRSETIRGESQGRMRLEDLEKDAAQVESTFIEFMNIREAYRI